MFKCFDFIFQNLFFLPATFFTNFYLLTKGAHSMFLSIFVCQAAAAGSVQRGRDPTSQSVR